jgi:hypothetical protein
MYQKVMSSGSPARTKIRVRVWGFESVPCLREAYIIRDEQVAMLMGADMLMCGRLAH